MAARVQTHQITMAIPDNEELDGLYDLLHAAEAAQTRGMRDTLNFCESILMAAGDSASEEERKFFLTAWKTLVDGGGLGRLLGAYECWRYECQHPGKDYVAWNARMRAALEADALAEVYREAYEESQARLNFLVSMFQIVQVDKGINRENPLEDFGLDVEVHPAPGKE